MRRRIVITGLGVVSSIGIEKEEFWKNALMGKSGISKIESFDTSSHFTHNGGEVRNFDCHQFLKPAEERLMGRSSQFAVASAKMALKDARLDHAYLKSQSIALCFGTTTGEGQEIEKIDYVWNKEGEEKVALSHIMKYPVNNLVANVANVLKMEGVGRMFTTACAAGNYAIGYGIDLIQLGKADLVIAGGADSFSYQAFTGFNQLRSAAPEKCQPFDKHRKGMMVGEGSGVLILETLDQAVKRNAMIYAELLGYGLSCDANHMTNPDSEGISRCMRNALKHAGIKENDVDYICAHGTGTHFNDLAESKALNNVFGDRTQNIPVNSLKSMLGHSMGAASAIEALSCCLTVKNGIIPPTINFETPDPECNIDCVANVMRKKDVNIALNNAFAFGGNNSCLVIKKYRKDK